MAVRHGKACMPLCLCVSGDRMTCQERGCSPVKELSTFEAVGHMLAEDSGSEPFVGCGL